MKVVANRSFFGSGVQAKKGAVIEVSDKLGKAWLKAGLVSKADSNAEPTVATTSSKPAPKPSDEAKTETTGEVVDDKQNSDGGDQPDATADKEPTTGDSNQQTLDEVKDEKADTTVVKSDDLTKTEDVKTDKVETVKADANVNLNTKKGSK
jgi:hypothetical protein